MGSGIDFVEVARLAHAARFAAKGACLKDLGTGLTEGLGFRCVEIVREGNQPPRLVLHGEAAVAVLEG